MRALSQDIIEWLAAEGHGTIGTDLFMAVEPDQPDDVVTAFDTGGSPDLMSGDHPIEEPTVMLRARNKDYRQGWERLDTLVRALTDDTRISVADSGAGYVGLWLMSGPMMIGRDEHERHRLTANLRCIRMEAD